MRSTIATEFATSSTAMITTIPAAAGIVVVMVVLLVANSVAIVLRNRFQRRS